MKALDLMVALQSPTNLRHSDASPGFVCFPAIACRPDLRLLQNALKKPSKA